MHNVASGRHANTKHNYGNWCNIRHWCQVYIMQWPLSSLPQLSTIALQTSCTMLQAVEMPTPNRWEMVRYSTLVPSLHNAMATLLYHNCLLNTAVKILLFLICIRHRCLSHTIDKRPKQKIKQSGCELINHKNATAHVNVPGRFKSNTSNPDRGVHVKEGIVYI